MIQQRVIPRKSNAEFMSVLLEKNSPDLASSVSQNVRRWVIFGGFVRDTMMGVNHQENDIDIGVIGETSRIIISKLEKQDRLRVDNGILESITNTIYPVRSIVADLPEYQASIDFVNMAHPMFKICDFTVNNLMYINTTFDFNARIVIEGKTRQETLALCMSDIYDGVLRFMMPTKISCSCRRHYVLTSPENRASPYCDFTSKFFKSCSKCELVFLEQQLKLVERLNKMLKKTHPKTGEKLFRLAEEPNFPSYYPRPLCQEETNDEVCSICQESFDDPRNTVITKCGHKYCASCMYSHVTSSVQLSVYGRNDSVSCPMCREKVVLQTLGDLSPVSQGAAEE